MQIEAAANYMHNFLQTKLSPSLVYHNYAHTLDVLNAAIRIAGDEGISTGPDLLLLKTAALYHDCGYAFVYKNHEDESCRIVKEVLPGFDYSDSEIEIICKIIMMTKLPSNPQTLLEKILCDADLDYLGSDDFIKHGDQLYSELHSIGRVENKNEWNKMQIKFLESHRYYTNSSLKLREAKKTDHLNRLKKSIS